MSFWEKWSKKNDVKLTKKDENCKNESDDCRKAGDKINESNNTEVNDCDSILKENILFYGGSFIGTSHIKKGTVCQDYSAASILKNNWVVVAIADGVGSAKHSDIASKLAVETIINVCKSYLIEESFNHINIEKILVYAYTMANLKIATYVHEKNEEIEDYDTTLDCVIYNGDSVFYGHSGDGGIIGLTVDGEFIKITCPQKGEDGNSVIPLRAGVSSWEFGCLDKRFVSVLLATDGIYDTLCPHLLMETETGIYIQLVRYFMDNSIVNANANNIGEIEKDRMDYINSDDYSIVTDDKTLFVLINPNVIPNQMDEAYYMEPDWEKLRAEQQRKLYPHTTFEEKEESLK